MPLPASLRETFERIPALDSRSDPPTLATASSPAERSLNYRNLCFDRNEDVIGRGGNAVVYRASLSEGSGTIAVKEPFPGRTIDRETTEQLLSEASKWAMVDAHPYITSVLDWGYDGPPWVAMEYMDSGSLTDRIEADDLAPEQRLWTAYAIVDAVAYASGRKGLAHHDITPNNVLFRETPGDAWDVPKVADWGLSRELIQHTGSISQATPEYAAPEHFEAIMPDAPVDVQTDVYQLGVVCYELLTGRHPNHLRTAVRPPSKVSGPSVPDLDDVILKSLEHDRRVRYDHPLLFRAALERVIERQQSTSAEPSPTAKPRSDSSVSNSTTTTPDQEVSESGIDDRIGGTGEASGLSALRRLDEDEITNLRRVGITSIDHLAEADDMRLSEQLERSPNEVARWIGEAKSTRDNDGESPLGGTTTNTSPPNFDEGAPLVARLDRVDRNEARNLAGMGISSVKDLADADEMKIARRLRRSPNEISRWIGEAKSRTDGRDGPPDVA